MNVPIKKAADLMGISEQFLRVLIQNEKLPFATAVKTKSQYQYYINSKGLSEHIGKEECEVVG
jgi:hypothetical protein